MRFIFFPLYNVIIYVLLAKDGAIRIIHFLHIVLESVLARLQDDLDEPPNKMIMFMVLYPFFPKKFDSYWLYNDILYYLWNC